LLGRCRRYSRRFQWGGGNEREIAGTVVKKKKEHENVPEESQATYSPRVGNEPRGFNHFAEKKKARERLGARPASKKEVGTRARLSSIGGKKKSILMGGAVEFRDGSAAAISLKGSTYALKNLPAGDSKENKIKNRKKKKKKYQN